MKRTIYLLGMIFAMLLLTACSEKAAKNEESRTVFFYKYSYATDKDAMKKIMARLLNADDYSSYRVTKEDAPYAIQLTYKNVKEDEVQSMVIHNATYLFALVTDLEEIFFLVGQQRYVVTKDTMQRIYQKKLEYYTDEKELNDIIDSLLNNQELFQKIFKK